MAWEIEYTDEFGTWFEALDEDASSSVAAVVDLLEEHGPHLGYPYSSGIETSRHPRMRELRVQHQGRPVRVFYAFDPRRTAILLIAGEKTGDPRFYERLVPRADALYDEHLRILEREGEI
jgi:hypothetical protein